MVVTIASGYVCYPFDTVSRKLMVQSTDKVKKYNNPYECAKYVMKHNGIRGFYGGAVSNAARGIGASLILVLYDDMKKFADKDKKEH